jgi:hypothetical protein
MGPHTAWAMYTRAASPARRAVRAPECSWPWVTISALFFGALGIGLGLLLTGCGGATGLSSEPCELSAQSYRQTLTVLQSDCSGVPVGHVDVGAVTIDPVPSVECRCQARMVECRGPDAWTVYDLSTDPATVTCGGSCTVVYSAVLTPVSQ